MIVLVIIFAVIVFLIIGLILYFISIYNGLIQLRQNIDKSWSNIDVLLKQRHDELPKLVQVCEAYMKYERETLEKVIRARNFYDTAKSVGDKAKADDAITGALKTLFAVAEQYPELQANKNFMQLQSRITDLENQIADRREFYNESVTNFNIRIQSIPDMFVAKMLNYTPHELFKVEAEDRKDVELKFKFPE